MSTIYIHVFGKFHITYDQQHIAGLESRKATELLSYLLVYRQQQHCREMITACSGRTAARLRPNAICISCWLCANLRKSRFTMRAGRLHTASWYYSLPHESRNVA